jgi:hypothetical protein
MKSVRHKGLALVAVSSSVLGVGIGMAGRASASAWAFGLHGPTIDLKVTARVGEESSAAKVLIVTTDNTGTTGQYTTTDFGDGSLPATTSTVTHDYQVGALKQKVTETSEDTGLSISSSIQVGIDATDPANIVLTRSTAINLAAPDAVGTTTSGNGVLDLSRILPAGTDLSGLSGTCDTGAGAPALSIDLKSKLASCDWPAVSAAGHHTVTLTYTDKATGLTSTSQEAVGVPVQPTPTFTAVVLSKGLVQLDLTGSTMDTSHGPDIGVLDWGDGTSTIVAFPLHNDAIQNHVYATYSGAPRKITFSMTDGYSEHASFSATVDDWTPSEVNFGQLTRLAGATRYGTGVAASQAAFPYANSAGAVVLARGDVYADALSGIPLAKYKNGPLLLTPGGPKATTLDPNVAAEIRRVLPMNRDRTVYILGGTDAIPQAVQDYIKNTLGYNVERFAGTDRYKTALAVAQNPDAMNSPGGVMVARGDDFADALAAGPLAAITATTPGGPPAAIVLSTGNGVTEPASLTPDTAKYITAKIAGEHTGRYPGSVTAVGGGAVKAVSALAHDPKAFTAIAGTDRYDTAAKVAAWWSKPWGGGAVPAYVGVASGTNFPDSLTGGAMMAQLGFPLLLSDPHSPALPPEAAATITGTNSSLMNTYLFGGTQVFGDNVAQSIMKLEGVTPAHYRIVTEPF